MSQRPARLSGWSAPEPVRSGWRRKREWLGWHTAAAVLLGIALPLIIAALAGAFDDLVRPVESSAEPESLREAYPQDWERGYAFAYEQTRGGIFAERVIVEQPHLRTDWTIGFRAGWAEGWNEALAAMRRTTLDADLPPTSLEHKVLERMAQRTADSP